MMRGGLPPSAPVTVESTGTEQLEVLGGVTGTRFQWEELTAAGAELRTLGAEVQGVVNELFRVQTELHETHQAVRWLPAMPDEAAGTPGPLGVTGGAARTPGAGGAGEAEPAVTTAAAALSDAATAATGHAEALQDAAHRIAASRLAYEAAEAASQAALAAVGLDPAAGRMRTRRTLALVNSAGFAEPGPIAVESLSSKSTAGQNRVEPTVRGLLSRTRHVQDAGDGVIEVLEVLEVTSRERMAGAGTARRFVVVLPGTQTDGQNATQQGPAGGTGTGSNPFDTTGIVEALRHDSRYLAGAVAHALEESGASAGDTVSFVGYSQGGMHAVNLAANRQLLERYDIPLVLTAGSPTGQFRTGEGVHLHLEHAEDWVPQADLEANPDERDRVTVRLRQTPVPVPEADKGLGPAHKLDTYLAGAESVDATAHPALVPVRARLAAAFGSGAGGAAAVAASRRFRLSRTGGTETNSDRSARSRSARR